MALRDAIGVRFSDLRGNHERHGTWAMDVFGYLPDGGCYGVSARYNSTTEYFESQYVVVGADGEEAGWSSQDVSPHQFDYPYYYPKPDAMVADPSGKTIVWLEEGRLWIWDEDNPEKKHGRLPACWSHDRLIVPGDPAIADARMNADSSLDVWCEDGSRYLYLVDWHVLLMPGDRGMWACALGKGAASEWGYGYVTASDGAAGAVGAVVCEDYDKEEYFSSQFLLAFSSFRELRFLKAVTRIESWQFEWMTELERVVIPEGIQMVGEFAFEGCGKLVDLVIEGDTTRVASWSKYAFSGCPCEAQYLEMRRKAQEEDPLDKDGRP